MDKREANPLLGEPSDRSTKAKLAYYLETSKNEIFSIHTIPLLSFIVLETGFTVLQKKVAANAPSFPYVLALAQPICTTTLFGILAIIAHFYTKKYEPNALPRPPLTLSLLISYGIIGLLLTITNFLMFSGSRGTLVPGPIIVLLRQLIIPFTMIVSIVLLKIRYSIQHYIGAFFILLGIIVSLIPQFRTLHDDGTAWAIFLIALAAVSLGSATLYMEHNIKEKKIRVFEMWTWINAFEILFALPLCLAMVPIQGIKVSGISANIRDGFSCLLEGDKFLHNECEDLRWWYLVLILFIVSDKSNLVYLLKYGSSTLVWMASPVSVPLSSFVFTSHWLMGNKATSLSVETIIGLVLVFVGLLVYKSTQSVEPKRYELINEEVN